MPFVTNTAAGALIGLFLIYQWSWWILPLSIIVFILGYILSDAFFRYVDEIPDCLNFASSGSSGAVICRRLRRDKPSVSGRSSPTCGVCDSDSCSRNGDTCESVASCGCAGPKVPKVVDDALQEFFQLTLKTYVDSWYESYITHDDKSFVKQLRIHLRNSLCRAFLKLRSLNLSHLILDEILPVAIGHAAVYADTMRRHGDSLKDDLEELVLQNMSSTKMLHPAMRSRPCELSYIKRVVDFFVSSLVDGSLSPATLTFLRELFTYEVCLPTADAVANPDVINRFLELLFDPLPMRTYDGELSEKVVMLNRFLDEKNPRSLPDTVVFKVKLSEIIRDTPTLYIFMKYLKSVDAPMNWLQFILSAHDIQEHLQSGRILTREDISHLHWQSWELYRNYLHDGAPDRLGDDVMPPEVVNELRLGVEAEPEQAMTIIGQVLEQAYQIMYQLVQWRYVTPFCQSSAFMETICAARHQNAHNEEELPREELPVVMQTFPVGRTYMQESIDEALGRCNSDSNGSEEEDVEAQQEPLLPTDGIVTAGLKDLSQWKVCLPKIEPRRDPQTGHTMYVYVVEVEAPLDSSADVRRWNVDRRYREFYVLENKLVEFHSESVLGGFPLPPKRTFNNKSRAFVEGQRPVFDQFLKRLLHNPALKGSELLRAFLTSSKELTVSFLPDPFKVMRTMPGKLAPERGQNLTPFLQSLVNSVLKPAPSSELKVPESSGRTSPYPADRRSPLSVASGGSMTGHKSVHDKLYNSQYKNNFDLLKRSASLSSTHGKFDDTVPSRKVPGPCVTQGVYDALLFLAQRIFQLAYIPFAILVSARCLFRRTFDGYVFRYLQQQLDEAMHEERLVIVIHELRDLVFSEDTVERSEEEKKQRKENAFAMAKLYFQTELGLVQRFVGVECFEEGVKLIFDCLQNPRLNKQLFYVLLDVVVREIFPELS